MRFWLTIVLVSLLSGPACKTTEPMPDGERPQDGVSTTNGASGRPEPMPSPPDAFEAASRWAASEHADAGDDVRTVLDAWAKPHVERVYRDGDVYRALVTGPEPDTNAQAVLLTLKRDGAAWNVVDAKLSRSTHLWPQKER